MRTADEIKAARQQPARAGFRGSTSPRPEARLGAKLQEARLRVDLTAKEVATELGVSGYSTVLNWEQGYSAPTPRHLTQLAALYGVPLVELCAHYLYPEPAPATSPAPSGKEE